MSTSTMTPPPVALASLVALRLDGPAGVCPAWLEAAERRCGKPSTVDLLCARHHGVAMKRHARNVIRDAALAERRRARAVERLPIARAELDGVERRYAALDKPIAADGAVVNTPLSRRMPSAARIHELANLVQRREQLAREIESLEAAL